MINKYRPNTDVPYHARGWKKSTGASDTLTKNVRIFVLTSLNIPFVREIDERMHRKLHKRPNTQSVWHRHSQILMLWCTNAHKLGIECIPNDVQSDGCAERWATPCNKSIKCLNIIWNDTSGRERPSSSMSTYRAPTDDENGQRCRVENMRKKNRSFELYIILRLHRFQKNGLL